MTERAFKINYENVYPSDMNTNSLIEQRDILWRAIRQAGTTDKPINYSAIVSRYNLICYELHRRGII